MVKSEVGWKNTRKGKSLLLGLKSNIDIAQRSNWGGQRLLDLEVLTG